MKIKKRTSVVENIIDSIVKSIIDGKYKPGDKIPSEEALVEELGVARTSVREATKILVYQGVLETRIAQGTFVTDGFQESMIDPMVYGIILNNSQEDFKNLMQLREMTEVGIMRIVILEHSQEDIVLLEKQLEVMNEVVRKDKYNYNDLFEEDNEFHNILGEISRNPMADKINRVVRTLTHAARYESVKNLCQRGDGQELIFAHRRLIDLIINADTENINEIVRGTYFFD